MYDDRMYDDRMYDDVVHCIQPSRPDVGLCYGFKWDRMLGRPRTRTPSVVAFTLVATAVTWSQAQESRPAAGAVGPTADAGASSGGTEPAAAPTMEACIEAHRQCQQAQQLSYLIEARRLANICASPSCPGMLVADCAHWLDNLDQRVPSVVFEVRIDGRANLTAEIWADDTRVTSWTKGEAYSLDPGKHTFRFALPHHEDVVRTVLLAEGMRYRVVSAEFTTPTEPDAAPAVADDPQPTTETHRPVPVLVYPLLGVGALGFAGWAGFGLAGKAEQGDLEGSCSPECTDDDLAPVRQKYLMADISLGIGAAALLGAGVMYLGRPEKPVATSRVGFRLVPSGAVATLSVRAY